MPATVYVMTVTHDGFSDDLEFQLPDNRRDLIVTSVDVEDGVIDAVRDGRNNITNTATGGQFTVGDAYLGNLGYLVGRNIIVGLNADNELMNFTVEDQDVVIAKVKYVEKDDANDDKNYFETPDETKYYLVDADSATTTIAETVIFDAANATIIETDAQAGAALNNGDIDGGEEFQYAKLVLNKNGRVATAVLQGETAWSGHIIVTETDDTTVIESADFALDFDGYTIVKDDEYVEVEDPEAGDICYYNSNDKFVDVFTESVTGNIEKITSEEITFDGTAYKWAGAQYLKSKKYATLAGTADTVEDDLAYLYSLDEDADTTIVLNRAGTVQVIDGTIKDEVKTTSSIYVLTEDGAQYDIGKTTYIELEGSNGTQETLKIDISKVTSYAGKDAKLTKSDETHIAVDGTALAATTAATFLAKTPVKITKNEDGVVVGIDLRETSAKVGSATLASGDDQTIKSDSTSLYVDATTKITLKSSTPVYIVNDKADDDGVAPFKVEKTTIGELTKTAKGAKVTAYAKSSSTNAEYVIIDNTAGDAWTTSDTETIGGVVTKVTKGLNTSSGKEEVEEITLLTASGEVVLDADELGYTGPYVVGDYEGFTVKKGTYTLAKEALTGDAFEAIETLDASRAYSDSKLTNQNATLTVSRAATSKVFVYDATEKTYTETTIGAVTTKKEQATLKYHIVDENGTGVVTADVMVVEYSGKAVPATITLASDAFTTIHKVGKVLGTTVENSDAGAITYVLQESADKATWTDKATTFTTSTLEIAANPITLTPAKWYRIKVTPTVTAKFATSYTVPVKTAAAVATYVGTGAGAVKTSVAATNTAHTGTGDAVDITAANAVLNQFGGVYTTGDADIASLATYTTSDLTTAVAGLTLAVTDTAGTLTATATGIGTATIPTSGTVYFEILGCVYAWTVTES